MGRASLQVKVRRAALAILVAAAAAGAASADEIAFGDAGCDLREGETGTVAEVLDAVTLRLDDGLAVRLAGIMPPADETEGAAALVGLVAGKAVTLRYGPLDRDRYDRAYAQLFLAGDPEVWVQSELVAGGYAVVAGFAEARDCLATLLMHERRARAENAGLWAERTPLDAWSPLLRNVSPRYELVEGRVVSIGRTERTVYLNFGNDWSVDFTVTINAADAGAFETGDLTFEMLIGQQVRIRGWLEQWDGPWMRVDHPEQIEVLNTGNGGDSG